MLKCPHCNKEVKEEEAIYNTRTKRYYHEDCYNALLDRKELANYICELFHYKKPSPKVFQQMAAYYEKGVSYADMLLALKYFYEIKKGDVSKAQGGIGIIPYILQEAKDFTTLEKIEQERLIEKFKLNAEQANEIKYVRVQERPPRPVKEININAL